jgi:hypothetical protein
MVLVIPLFLLMMVGILQLATLFKARLELVALSRELPLVLSRQCGPTGAPSERQALSMLRNLASRAGSLDPKRLSLSFGEEGDAKTLGNGVLAWFSSRLAGQKITLAYQYKLGGAAGVFLPRGLELEETVFCVLDPWKNPGQKIAGMLAP